MFVVSHIIEQWAKPGTSYVKGGKVAERNCVWVYCTRLKTAKTVKVPQGNIHMYAAIEGQLSHTKLYMNTGNVATCQLQQLSCTHEINFREINSHVINSGKMGYI